MSIERPKAFEQPSRPQVGMPRRFGIGTAMILTAMFAAVCSVLKLLDATPAVYVGVSVFVIGVVASQALLFKGKDPRHASIISGAIIFYAIWVVVSLTAHFGPRDYTRETTFSLSGALILLAIGGLLGYVVGWLFAAVFLVHKERDDWPSESPAVDDIDVPGEDE
jgi:hypothetical protein